MMLYGKRREFFFIFNFMSKSFSGQHNFFCIHSVSILNTNIIMIKKCAKNEKNGDTKKTVMKKVINHTITKKKLKFQQSGTKILFNIYLRFFFERKWHHISDKRKHTHTRKHTNR